MTELPISGEGLTASGLLAATAGALLVFVSLGVIYLSAVEWRDRRRRKADEKATKASGRSAARSGSGSTSRSSGQSSGRSPTAFGRRP
ncbi:MAG: hypothetical protein WBN89_14450 [Prochlorococcaceae cyanobacterium]